ncbi:hypothetical protein [Burkholderia phage BCSR5]|nr:hypothetical protein [Burkholderia phage BCSR5]
MITDYLVIDSQDNLAVIRVDSYSFTNLQFEHMKFCQKVWAVALGDECLIVRMEGGVLKNELKYGINLVPRKPIPMAKPIYGKLRASTLPPEKRMSFRLGWQASNGFEVPRKEVLRLYEVQ